MESPPISDVKTHLEEADGVSEEIRFEQNNVPRLCSQLGTPNGKRTSKRRKLKGEIREIGDGNIEWRDDIGWVPAVFHNSLREKLIKQAEELGSYDHPRKHGLDPLDVTSYHPDQKTWGPDRDEHWPLMPDQLLFRLECQGYPVPNYKVTRWIDDGRVVLDVDNLPVKGYHSIPLTLSSEMEGYLIEMILRMDTRITHRDLRARMPHTIQTVTGTKPIFSLSAISWRLTRFRLENACPSWAEQQPSGGLKRFVMSLLSEEGLKRNSTQELSGLTKLQQEIVKKGPNRKSSLGVGTWVSNPVSHAQREQTDARHWTRSQAAAEKEKNEDFCRGEKRERDDDSLLVFDDGSSTLNPPPAKFGRLESEGRGGSILEPPSSSELESLDDLIENFALANQNSEGKFGRWMLVDKAFCDRAHIHRKGSSTPLETRNFSEHDSELAMTIIHYHYFLGCDPPPTNPEDDFDTRYNDIQRDFNARWNGEGPAPKLQNIRTWKPELELQWVNEDILAN